MFGKALCGIAVVIFLVVNSSYAIGAQSGDWLLEGNFVSYNSLCDLGKPDLSPRSVQVPPGISFTITACGNLEEELQQPLALVIKIQNVTTHSRILEVPLPSDLVFMDGQLLRTAFAIYFPWAAFSGLWAKGEGRLQVEVDPDSSVEFLYLIPLFSGEATIEFGDTGAFEIATDLPKVNNPPVAVGDGYSVDEDNTLTISAPGVLGNDSDVDSDSLTATRISDPSHGTLTLNSDGSFTYTPSPEYSGTDRFTYKANDGNADSDIATVNISVNPVNDPPVMSDIPDQSINEGEAFTSITLDDYVSDPDNENSEIAWAYRGNVELTIAISNSTITVTIPDPCWSGSETITFTATDPDGLASSDSATFTVTPVNDPPVMSDVPDQEISESDTFASVSLDDYISDPCDDDSEIAWAYGGNIELSVTISDDRVAIITTPDPEWNGSESITFTATDPEGLSDSDSATFTVKPLVVLPGDVNNDGQVRSNDATLALQFAAGLMEPTRYQKRAADMNADGKIGANDALLILIAAAGSAAPDEGYVASAGAPVTITMDEAHGVAGDRITIPVKIDNVGGLAGGDIHIFYNSAVLRAVSASSESGVLLASNVAEPGMIRIAFAGTGSLNSRKLAEIQFDILTDDVSPLKLQRVDLYQPNALPIDSRPVDSEFRSWAIPVEHSALLQNFPNPFNPDTWIPYQLKESDKVTIQIFNVAGELVRKLDLGYKSAGLYVSSSRAAYWNGRNEAGEQVSSGVYFYNIQAGEFTATKKMVVAK
ncbi:Ig-like domain-containing protein [Candidatus Poribacteria bacterium]